MLKSKVKQPSSNSNHKPVKEAFDLTGRVSIITGGAGLLGVKYAEAIAEMGGSPVLLDIDTKKAASCAEKIIDTFGVRCLGLGVDITRPEAVSNALSKTIDTFGCVDILINNAANNPKVEDTDRSDSHWSRLENFPLEVWSQDLSVGLTGAFLCSQIIGSTMAQQGKGTILNIASDLALIAPNQRIYRQPGLSEDQQLVKPVTYSVVKSGILGLTRYLATYWAEKGVRVNAISPGGVYNNQNGDFVERLKDLIPMSRMAHTDEFKAAIIFLVSDASSYMTGANLVMDGGRTCW